jgi:ATP-dependent NAD(P)H-hydrate dehydratase
VGADLSHVFCTQGAGPVIKTFSPELIVHPYLHEQSEAEAAGLAFAVEQCDTAADAVSQWFSRLDVLVVGPGLGRDPMVLQTVAEIIRRAREVNLPVVIDADGLYIITTQPDLVRGYQVCFVECVVKCVSMPPITPHG